MIQELKDLSDFERAEYMQNILIDRATGGTGDDFHYNHLRGYFFSNSTLKTLIPHFIKVKELAVNLAGSMALFLIQTHEASNS